MKQLPDQSITISPTDLANYQNCQHLIAQDLNALRGGPPRPVRQSAIVDVLRERGLAHEAADLAHLRGQGVAMAVKPPQDATASHGTHSANETLALMQSGQQAIYQATLTDGTLTGISDFLVRVDQLSALGNWSYQAIDTKLAQETRVGTIIQLCVYSELISKWQGCAPQDMGVVPRSEQFHTVWYRYAGFSAYYQMLRSRLDAFIQAPTATYPEPVSHCDDCAWWSTCDKRRRSDDHLGFVAGIQSTQAASLREVSVTTMTQLAEAGELSRPKLGSLQALQTKELTRVRVLAAERAQILASVH